MGSMNDRPHRLERIRGGDHPIWQTVDLTTGSRSATAACARQAATGYFGEGRRNIVEAVKQVRGVMVPCTVEELDACDVSVSSWTWPFHGHTHRHGPVRV